MCPIMKDSSHVSTYTISMFNCSFSLLTDGCRCDGKQYGLDNNSRRLFVSRDLTVEIYEMIQVSTWNL